jgi:hypothetical protein
VKSRIFFPHNKLNPTVFFPAFRRIVIGQWLQTTHPHGIESLLVNISLDNFLPDRKSAVGGKAHVVVWFPRIVGVAFDAKKKVGMTVHHRDNAVDFWLGRIV